MVVGDPPRLAPSQEIAPPAERDGKRIDVDPGVDRRHEPLPHPPVVRHEVVDAEALALLRPEHDVHPLRHGALNPPDLLGIEAELKHVTRLRMPRELRVDHLVPPVSLPLHEVGKPTPATVDETGLVDHVGACAHRVLGRQGGSVEVEALERDRGDGAAVREKLFEIGGLVLVALPLDEIGLRVLGDGLPELVPRDGELELGQVLALEERVQVRGQEEDLVVALVHTGSISARSVGSYGSDRPKERLAGAETSSQSAVVALRQFIRFIR